ncbi:hypothetical protein AVEN_163991-1 [Araneus ventricosus]|uniref:Uncharacterized protein n=1 Tax=Araneus ventricosus TaxID=182803 RepID=A0A4Y2D9L9_ARAVE|nr:hypothetical protein AVEN_163991-1 [Araneus ventricosus]
MFGATWPDLGLAPLNPSNQLFYAWYSNQPTNKPWPKRRRREVTSQTKLRYKKKACARYEYLGKNGVKPGTLILASLILLYSGQILNYTPLIKKKEWS